jgi:hypothetical protein
VVIVTDCTGSCKSNHHTITTTVALPQAHNNYQVFIVHVAFSDSSFFSFKWHVMLFFNKLEFPEQKCVENNLLKINNLIIAVFDYKIFRFTSFFFPVSRAKNHLLDSSFFSFKWHVMLFFNTDYLVRYNIYIYMLKQVMLLGVNITIYIITLIGIPRAEMCREQSPKNKQFNHCRLWL